MSKLIGWMFIFLLPYLTFFGRSFLVNSNIFPGGDLFVPIWFWLYFVVGVVVFGIGFMFIEKRVSDYLLAGGGILSLGILTAFFLYALWVHTIQPLLFVI